MPEFHKRITFSIRLGILFSGLFFFGMTTLHAQEKSYPTDTVITGPISRESLAAHFSWFPERYDAYHPKDSIMQVLKPVASQLSFVLVIGTWCSDSREHVPAFFKVADQLDIAPDSIRVIGVARKKDRVLTAELDTIGIEYVPTFIVYRNGMELGRIVEDTKVSMERDLLDMLQVR